MSTNISNIFSSLGSSTSSSGINLGDYAAIKNGSYKKLLKAYYKEQDSTSTEKTKDDIKAEKQKNELMSTTASDLNEAARKLMDTSLLEKKTGEDGTADYDRDAIGKAVKNFVDAYNKTIDEAAESDNTSVLRSTVWTTNMMKKNAGLLEEIGVKVGADNKLTLDEDKLKSADVSTLKSLFQGHGSLVGRVSQKASAIATSAANAAGTYNKSGKVSTAVSELLSSKFDTEV